MGADTGTRTPVRRGAAARSQQISRVFQALQPAPEPLATAEDWMAEQHAIWNQRLDRMQDYVEGAQRAK